jgi:hypothetical protein
MTEGEFGRVLGAVLVRAFDEIRAAANSPADASAPAVTGSPRGVAPRVQRVPRG